WPRAGGMQSLRQCDFDPAVSLAFAADLQYPNGTDLGGIAHMRAAAGLQVDARNPQQPYLAGTARRLNAHGLDQLGLCVQLLVGNPLRLRLYAARDQRVRVALDPVRIEQAHVDIEVKPAL